MHLACYVLRRSNIAIISQVKARQRPRCGRSFSSRPGKGAFIHKTETARKGWIGPYPDNNTERFFDAPYYNPWFKYSRLKPHEYRFAVLREGHLNDPIACDILHKNLEGWGAPEPTRGKLDFQWEALSWTWGVHGEMCTIQVDSKPFQVTRNLYIALSHLRHENKSRIFWIDAICINQEDTSERNDQVSKWRSYFGRPLQSQLGLVKGIRKATL